MYASPISEVTMMKKRFFVFILAIVMSTVVACGTKEDGETGKNNDTDAPLPPAEVEVKEGEFIYRLFSEKDVYEVNSDLAIFAELTYVGEEESINIYHAASPFYFPLEERTRGIEIGYAMNDPLITTTLKKGKPFRQKYSFAGGYSEKDKKEYVDFVKTIISNGFPEGEYIIHGNAQFFTGTPGEKENHHNYNMKGDIGFNVVKEVK